MSKYRDFSPGNPFPADFVDALNEMLSTYASPNLRVVQSAATQLQIVAGTGNAQVGLAVNGMWRWNTATITAAHPGGTAGLYDLYALASANSFTTGSGGEEVDSTPPGFTMRIMATTASPTGTGGETHSRKIASVLWTGSAIKEVYPLLASPSDGVPIGTLLDFAGSAAPTNYLIADGSEKAIATYPQLAGQLGTTYGALTNGSGGAGTTHFRLPNHQGRVSVGVGTATGAPGATAKALGGAGGEEKHTLTAAESGVNGNGIAATVGDHAHSASSDTQGSHNHTGATGQGAAARPYPASGYYNANTAVQIAGASGFGAVTNWGATGSGDGNHAHGISTDGAHAHGITVNAGGSHQHALTARAADSAHENMPPYVVVNKIIKAL
jgi:microcystin-dependent protein